MNRRNGGENVYFPKYECEGESACNSAMATSRIEEGIRENRYCSQCLGEEGRAWEKS